MRKLLFCFGLAVSSMSAAAIVSTQAICDDVVVNGTSLADCGLPPPTYPPPTHSPGQGGLVYSLKPPSLLRHSIPPSLRPPFKMIMCLQ